MAGPDVIVACARLLDNPMLLVEWPVVEHELGVTVAWRGLAESWPASGEADAGHLVPVGVKEKPPGPLEDERL